MKDNVSRPDFPFPLDERPDEKIHVDAFERCVFRADETYAQASGSSFCSMLRGEGERGGRRRVDVEVREERSEEYS